MLLMTRRPSATTPGSAAKSESSSTSCATWLAACAPDAIAMPQSASFNASTSFTPSPVMATVWPFACKAWTSWRFCSGVTRPKTVHFSAASASAASLCSVAASTQCSAPAMPALAATWLTACGSSPEMTLIFTPCFAKKRNVLGALSRMRFCNGSKAKNSSCAVSSAAGGSGSVPLYFASSSTRRPWASSGVSLSASSPALLPASTSGAPTT